LILDGTGNPDDAIVQAGGLLAATQERFTTEDTEITEGKRRRELEAKGIIFSVACRRGDRSVVNLFISACRPQIIFP
jgi:hypothetical protein